MKKTIILFILLIIPISVNAAECSNVTIERSRYNGSGWFSITNPWEDDGTTTTLKFSTIFTNTNIKNNAVILRSHYIIKTFRSEEDLLLEARLKNSSTYQIITNTCNYTETRSCADYNDNLCITTNHNINIVCSINSNDPNARAIEIILSNRNNGEVIRYYNDNNCLEISASDTDRIIESQNNNGNQITDAINDNGETIDHELESINETISDMFQNMGSCREQPHLIMKHNYKLDSSGNEVADNNYGISGYIRVYKDTQINRTTASTDQVYMCFYGNNNQLISCETERQVVGVTIPANTYFVRYTWSQVEDKPRIDMCSKSNDMTQQTLDQMAEDLNKFREDYNNSQQVCFQVDKNIITQGKQLDNNGNVTNTGNTVGTTDYLNIFNATLKLVSPGTSINTCFYNINKTFISCIKSSNYNQNDFIPLPNNSYYMRTSINYGNSRPVYEICKNSGDALYMTLTESGNGNGLGGLNMTDTNETLNKESQLMNNTFNTNTINITYDQTAWSWVFTQMTRILETNSLIMGMVITVLSIGLIKTVMGR